MKANLYNGYVDYKNGISTLKVIEEPQEKKIDPPPIEEDNASDYIRNKEKAG